eukprot:347166-Chlamydomonas_euryale.AAC.2
MLRRGMGRTTPQSGVLRSAAGHTSLFRGLCSLLHADAWHRSHVAVAAAAEAVCRQHHAFGTRPKRNRGPFSFNDFNHSSPSDWLTWRSCSKAAPWACFCHIWHPSLSFISRDAIPPLPALRHNSKPPPPIPGHASGKDHCNCSCCSSCCSSL